ncbi:MAG: efflux RND transporter permease subunit [Planctomycetota bacterium]
MKGLYRYGVRHPVATLVVALVVTAALAPGLARLALRTDGHALVPADAPEVLADAVVREAFGVEDLVVVLIRTEHPDGIYNVETLRLVSELSDALAAIDGLGRERITSLATEKGDRNLPGTLDFYQILSPPPATAADVARVRDEVNALAIHRGTLVSDDARGTAIHVGVPPSASRDALYRDIRAIVDDAAGPRDTIDVIGAPVAEALLGAHILQDLGVPGFLLGEAPPTDQPVTTRDRSLRALPRHMGRAIGLVPMAIAVMALVLLISFRRVAAVPIPLLEVGACLTVVFSVMGWLGVPVYLTIAVLPVILTSIGVADEVHIMSRYQQRLAAGDAGGGRAACILATMDDVAPAIVRTSLTTAAAFCTFALSPIAPVRAFGLLAALGIGVCLLWSLTATPALLMLVDPRRLEPRTDVPLAGWPTQLALAASRRAGFVLAGAAVVIALAVLGLQRLHVQDSWIDGFAAESRFARATRWFDEHFFGAHVLLVSVDTDPRTIDVVVPVDQVEHHAVVIPGDVIDDPSRLGRAQLRVDDADAAIAGGWLAWIASGERTDDGRIIVRTPREEGSLRVGARTPEGGRVRCTIAVRPMLDPEILRVIADLEAWLAERGGGVGGVLGPTDFVTTTNFIVGKRDPATRRLPDDPGRAHFLWQQHERIRGSRRAGQVVDEARGAAVISVFLEQANYRDTARLIDDLRAYEAEHLAPRNVTITLAGDVAVSQALIAAITTTQVRSLLVSLLVIIAITSILGRSLRWGLACVVPCAAAVLVTFAVMGWTGTPLGVATSMFAGMIIGIGVDYAIHLVERFRRVRGAADTTADAIRDTTGVAGRAIVIDAITVGLGFGVLICSQVPADARLGMLAVLCIATCLAATLLLLPLVMRFVPGPAEPPSRP